MAPDSPSLQRGHAPRRTASSLRLVLMVAAVVSAVVGLVSLGAILAIAWLQGTIWPGFLVATYVCLPLAFLLMCALIIDSVIGRRRL